MPIIETIKKQIILSSIQKRKKKNGFDEKYAEAFQLAPDSDENQNNSYYFSCHDIAGNSLFIRLGLRGGGSAEIWFAFMDAAGNAYVNRDQLVEARALNIGVKCLDTAKKWEFSFQGAVMQIMQNKKPADCLQTVTEADFTGIFSATAPIFEFSYHMDPLPMARALAKEKWGKNFKADLEANHQVHYEQVGNVEGDLIINGNKTHVAMPAVRDHSFGKRDWAYMGRHIWLMALLENGDALNISMVRYPAVRNIEAGYYTSGAQTVCLETVTPMDDLPLTGGVPDDFSLTGTFSDGRQFTLSCKKEMQFAFPFKEGAYMLYEGIGSFDLDGIKGRGILEFGFNRDKERWA